MSASRTLGRHAAVAALLCLWLAPIRAEVPIAVLDFELNDLTLLPRTPEELQRVASIKPLLEQELRARSSYRVIAIDPQAAAEADAGVGYLFDHPEAAARLGREHGADWVLVGRLHKPSFLFAYLMARLVDARNERLTGNYVVEVKGPASEATGRGIERLAEKIDETLTQ